MHYDAYAFASPRRDYEECECVLSDKEHHNLEWQQLDAQTFRRAPQPVIQLAAAKRAPELDQPFSEYIWSF
jgi:hypothetical protein